ncbi:MAG: ABC transporter ATP-binding protein [Clostridia bacterium]|nr:ABC transporter ATP-binding protein [Clostridia bacterium]
MKLIFSYMKPFRARMLLGLTVKVLGTVSELFLPLILTHILDVVIVAPTSTVWTVIAWGGLMLFAAVSACILNIVANRMAARVSSDISGVMRQDLFEKTLRLGSRNVDRFTVPSLESRLTTDTYNVHSFIGMVQRMGVRAPILLIGGVTITLIMDAYLATVMLVALPFIIATALIISRLGIGLYSRVQRSVDGMVKVVREDVQGVRVIKALSKGEYENRRYDTVNRALSASERRAGVIMGLSNPIMNLFMNLGIAGVVALCALRAKEDPSSAVTVIAFMQYFTLISMSMMVMSRVFTMMTKCIASAKRIEEIIMTPESYEVIQGEKDDTGAYISFENVSFSYLGVKNNLDNISFSVKRGESLGIIGSTGSGKSTVIKLLLRFYEPDSGRITVDGRDIKEYTREELASRLGVVIQNDFLMADTVSENIRFGRDISDEDVRRAAKIAQADKFIEELEGGYEHALSPKGTNLSGGQRQRILISRAVASDPDILILDDSSSALDYKTDANLRRAIKENMRDTTLITVAQRVSSVMSSSLILVLEGGRIIGKGTHDELMASCNEYKEISDSQMGGAILG